MSDTIKIRATLATRLRERVVGEDFLYLSSDGTLHLVKAGTVLRLPEPAGPIVIETTATAYVTPEH